jgi:gamma-glutamylcyclotransferase (GGCT)/AIG2-like uncharacterized protein YtfP
VCFLEKNYVFVYGSLRKHHPNAQQLKNADCIAEQSWTKGNLLDSGYGFPYLVPSDGKVYGELYSVDDDELHALDRLEGYHGEGRNNHYERVIQKVVTDNGAYQAFVYILADFSKAAKMDKIQCGDWGVYSLLKQKELLYFAYGSCMDNERFRKAGVDHYFQRIRGTGILGGYTIRFTRKSFNGGRADIVEEGGRVEGKVYEVSKESLAYLYQREGVEAGCYRPAIINVSLNGLLLKNVLTFIVVEKEAETAPPQEYVEEIFRGAAGYVSEGYLELLRKKLQVNFNLTIQGEFKEAT